MNALFLLLTMSAIGLVLWWEVKNDRIAPTGRSEGILAMRDAAEPQTRGKPKNHARTRSVRAWAKRPG